MGFFAGSLNGDDLHPVEDFSVPPGPNAPRATVSGVVRDSISGRPVPGVLVDFAGHDSGFPGSYVARTNSAGHYAITGVVLGRYPEVTVTRPGYNRRLRTVVVDQRAEHFSLRLVRDWAAASGGARIVATNGNQGASFGCGAAALIDQDVHIGWSTPKPRRGGRYATVRLPAAVDIVRLRIDPSATCGDDAVASTGQFRLETSPDGSTYRVAAAGTFTPGDVGHLVSVPLRAGTGTGVAYVRYTMLSNQAAQRGVTCPNSPEGCRWLDSRELEITGTPAGG
jgi:hypothetical protein